MSEQRKSIGVIGLGIMGAAMAANLLKAGFKVSVYNRTPAKAKELEAKGALVCSSPRKLVAGADVVIIMVTGPNAVWDVVRGDDGVFAETGNQKVLVQMSTLDVATTLALAEEALARGYRYLDCPVTGSKKQVEAAELIIEAGGSSETLNEVHSVLMAIGKHVVHAGAVGSGTALKLCMNLVVAQMTTAVAEATAFARALDIDPSHIFEVLENSPALNCVYYKLKREPLLKRNYPPAFSLANMLKDVRFMNAEAKKRNLKLPVTRAVQDLMEQTAEQNDASLDLSVILEALL